MSKLVHNYTANGSSTTDEYGTHLVLNRYLRGDVIEGFKVVANGSPNMTVKVEPGSGRVSTGTYPSSYGYLISHDTVANESVTISAAAASPRIDYIVAYVDKVVPASTSPSDVNNTNNVLKFAAVAGTPAGSPNPPSVGQIQTAIGASNPYIIIAQVAVAASATQITNANITDLRTFIAERNAKALGRSNFIESGLIWSAVSGLNGTMTAGAAHIKVGSVLVEVSLSAIASRAFTASRDTYVAVDYLGTVSYNEVTNNNSSPSLPANSVWVAVVITNGSAITSVNTGQIGAAGPTVSGRILMISDTNGQLIYPTARQRLIAYAQITANATTTSTSAAAVTGLSVKVIIPDGVRRVRVSADAAGLYSSSTTVGAIMSLWDGTVGSGTQLDLVAGFGNSSANGATTGASPSVFISPTGTKDYNVGLHIVSAGTATIDAGATKPAYVAVEIE